MINKKRKSGNNFLNLGDLYEHTALKEIDQKETGDHCLRKWLNIHE